MTQAPALKGRREKQRNQMRVRLLNAALKLFIEHGYKPTTIDQIAQQADVARQTVLNHYPLKRDFLRAWGQQRRERLLELAKLVEPNESAQRQLQSYYAALAQMNEQERELTQVLFLSLRHDELLAHERPVPEAVLRAIHRGQERSEFKPTVNPSLTAEVLTAIYFDTLSRWLLEAERPFKLEDVLANKLDMVFGGLELIT